MWTIIVIALVLAGLAFWLYRSFDKNDGVETSPERIVDAVAPVWTDTVVEIKEAIAEVSAPAKAAAVEVADVVKDDVEVLVEGAKASVAVVAAYTDSITESVKAIDKKAKKAAVDKKSAAKAEATKKKAAVQAKAKAKAKKK